MAAVRDQRPGYGVDGIRSRLAVSGERYRGAARQRRLAAALSMEERDKPIVGSTLVGVATDRAARPDGSSCLVENRMVFRGSGSFCFRQWAGDRAVSAWRRGE